MGSEARHDGTFDNPVEGQRGDIPSRVRDGLVMRIIKRVVAPVATLAMLAGTPGCTKADLDNARTQVTYPDTTKPSDNDDNEGLIETEEGNKPFRRLWVWVRLNPTGTFSVELAMPENLKGSFTSRMYNETNDNLSQLSGNLENGKGYMFTQDGLKCMNTVVAEYSNPLDKSNMPTKIEVEFVDENGGNRTTKTIDLVTGQIETAPTTVAGVDPE